MWLAQNILVQQLNHATTYPVCDNLQTSNKVNIAVKWKKKTQPNGRKTASAGLKFTCNSVLLSQWIGLLEACSQGQRLVTRKANDIVPFCRSPDQGDSDPFSQTKREYNTILGDADSVIWGRERQGD